MWKFYFYEYFTEKFFNKTVEKCKKLLHSPLQGLYVKLFAHIFNILANVSSLQLNCKISGPALLLQNTR